MASTTARENILNKIKQALRNPVPVPFPDADVTQPLFTSPAEDAIVIFAEEFTGLQGKFAYCPDTESLIEQLSQLIQQRSWDKIWFKEPKITSILKNVIATGNLEQSDVAITGCECLVARTGTIVLSSALTEGRTGSVYSPVHICIAWSSQMTYDIKDAFAFLKQKYNNNIPSLISFASGPSRTADIEKTLVTGVHGPKEVFCFLVEG